MQNLEETFINPKNKDTDNLIENNVFNTNYVDLDA